MDYSNITQIYWSPLENKPPYKDGYMTVILKEKKNIKGYMTDRFRVRCTLERFKDATKKISNRSI